MSDLALHHGIIGPVLALALLGAFLLVVGFALTVPVFVARHLGRGFRKGFSEKSLKDS